MHQDFFHPNQEERCPALISCFQGIAGMVEFPSEGLEIHISQLPRKCYNGQGRDWDGTFLLL